MHRGRSLGIGVVNNQLLGCFFKSLIIWDYMLGCFFNSIAHNYNQNFETEYNSLKFSTFTTEQI